MVRCVFARLCQADEAKGTGCGADTLLIWTADVCTIAGQQGRVAAGGSSQYRPQKTRDCHPAGSTVPSVRCCADAVVDVTASPPPTQPGTTRQTTATAKPSTQKNTFTTHLLPAVRSIETCADKAWQPVLYGAPTVCGGSVFGTLCLSNQNWKMAAFVCSTYNVRLCTANELKADEARGTSATCTPPFDPGI